jgi:hypothetical protein
MTASEADKMRMAAWVEENADWMLAGVHECTMAANHLYLQRSSPCQTTIP